jgi:hypothetical protein
MGPPPAPTEPRRRPGAPAPGEAPPGNGGPTPTRETREVRKPGEASVAAIVPGPAVGSWMARSSLEPGPERSFPPERRLGGSGGGYSSLNSLAGHAREPAASTVPPGALRRGCLRFGGGLGGLLIAEAAPPAPSAIGRSRPFPIWWGLVGSNQRALPCKVERTPCQATSQTRGTSPERFEYH